MKNHAKALASAVIALACAVSPASAAKKNPTDIKAEAAAWFVANGVKAIGPDKHLQIAIDIADSFGSLKQPNMWEGAQTYATMPIFLAASNCYVKANGAEPATCDEAISWTALPKPTASTLGGVLATSRPTNQYVSGVNPSTGGLIFDSVTPSSISGVGSGVASALSSAVNGSGGLASYSALRALGTGSNATANAFTASNQALFIEGALSGNGLGPYSLISVTDTATNTTPRTFINGLWVAHTIGTGAGEGSRNAILPILTIANPLPCTTGTNCFHSASFPQVYVSANLGGDAGTSKGDVYGNNGLAQLESGATYVNSVTGGKLDVSVQSGAAVKYKSGMTIASVNSDAVKGSTYDAMLSFLRDNTTTAPWTLGIGFGRPDATWPFDSTSTIIGTSPPGTGSRVALDGVDFSGVTFSGCAFKSANGFCVTQGGVPQSPALPGITTDVQGTGMPGLNQGNWFIYSAPVSYSGLPTFRADRTVPAGAVGGGLVPTLWALTNIPETDATFEWSVLGQLENYSLGTTGSENVATNGVATKHVASANVGATWGGHFICNDYQNRNNPTYGCIGAEVGVGSNSASADDNNVRWALLVNNGGVAGAQHAGGILLGTNAGVTMKTAISFQGVGTTNIGLDFSPTTFANNPILCKAGQCLGFDADPVTKAVYRKLYVSTGLLTYNAVGSTVMTVSDAGNLSLAGSASAPTITASDHFTLANMFAKNTAPTISSGFCTSPTVTNTNGTLYFHVNVGTGCAASNGVIGMPTASHGWICSFFDTTSPGSIVVAMTAHTASTVSLQAYSRTTGLPTNFPDNDVIHGTCMGG